MRLRARGIYMHSLVMRRGRERGNRTCDVVQMTLQMTESKPVRAISGACTVLFEYAERNIGAPVFASLQCALSRRSRRQLTAPSRGRLSRARHRTLFNESNRAEEIRGITIDVIHETCAFSLGSRDQAINEAFAAVGTAAALNRYMRILQIRREV